MNPRRTNSIASENAQFFNPNTYANASVTSNEATLNIAAAGGSDGLAYVSQDNTFTSEEFGVFGSLSAQTAGQALGSNSEIRFSFNGNFTGNLIPEPTALVLLGLGFTGFIFRRNRR